MKNIRSSNQVPPMQERSLGNLPQTPGSFLASEKPSQVQDILVRSHCSLTLGLKPTSLAEGSVYNWMQSEVNWKTTAFNTRENDTPFNKSPLSLALWLEWGGERFPEYCILLSRCIRIKGKMVARETRHSCQLCRRLIIKRLQGALHSHKHRQEHSQPGIQMLPLEPGAISGAGICLLPNRTCVATSAHRRKLTHIKSRGKVAIK